MFKVGDKVVCINDADSGESLEFGKIYTVDDVQENYVILEGNEYSWMSSRFVLYVEVDHLVEISQSEYTALVEEINLLQELLSEANQKLTDCLLDKMESIANNINKINQSIPEPTALKLGEFKPVPYYTMSDWEQALAEKWVFKLYDGTITNIISLDYSDTSYKVETETAWLRLDGTEYDFGSSDSDILKRIK